MLQDSQDVEQLLHRASQTFLKFPGIQKWVPQPTWAPTSSTHSHPNNFYADAEGAQLFNLIKIYY